MADDADDDADETRIVRRPALPSPVEDATRVVKRDSLPMPDDATRVVDRSGDDRTRVVDRSTADDRTVVRPRPRRVEEPGPVAPLVRGGRTAFVPSAEPGAPADTYAIREVPENAPIVIRNLAEPTPGRRLPLESRNRDELDRRAGSRRGIRVLLVVVATVVVAAGIVVALAIALF